MIKKSNENVPRKFLCLVLKWYSILLSIYGLNHLYGFLAVFCLFMMKMTMPVMACPMQHKMD